MSQMAGWVASLTDSHCPVRLRLEHTEGTGYVCKLFSKGFGVHLGQRAVGADSTQTHRAKQEDEKKGTVRSRKSSEQIKGNDKHEERMERDPSGYKRPVSLQSAVGGF